MVTSFGKPIVKVPDDSATSTSFAVPCTVSVPPPAIADELEPSVTVNAVGRFVIVYPPKSTALLNTTFSELLVVSKVRKFVLPSLITNAVDELSLSTISLSLPAAFSTVRPFLTLKLC